MSKCRLTERPDTKTGSIPGGSQRFFPQRAAAALFAASLRCSGVIFAARAFPPFKPPLRPSATAAGSFPASGFGSSVSPVARSTMSLASWFGSRGRLRERSGMYQS
jgi:hypothetical protein